MDQGAKTETCEVEPTRGFLLSPFSPSPPLYSTAAQPQLIVVPHRRGPGRSKRGLLPPRAILSPRSVALSLSLDLRPRPVSDRRGVEIRPRLDRFLRSSVSNPNLIGWICLGLRYVIGGVFSSP